MADIRDLTTFTVGELAEAAQVLYENCFQPYDLQVTPSVLVQETLEELDPAQVETATELLNKNLLILASMVFGGLG